MRTEWSRFMEIAFGTKRTVNLIGRYLMITYPFTPGRISVFIFTGYPCATCGIQQVLCSQNIGHQEKLRILNATVYMAFSSKIHYIVKLVLTKKAVGQFTIANVTFHKKATFVINVVGNRSKISGISQCIEHYHLDITVFSQNILQIIGTDKSGSTGYKISFHILYD